MLSPADGHHLICLYHADKNIEFRPDLRLSHEQNLLVAQNPVAAVCFFDLMIHMFIKHVHGVGIKHSGLYGNTAGHYGTVEQQGQLTLHLHMMLWRNDEICEGKYPQMWKFEQREFIPFLMIIYLNSRKNHIKIQLKLFLKNHHIYLSQRTMQIVTIVNHQLTGGQNFPTLWMIFY